MRHALVVLSLFVVGCGFQPVGEDGGTGGGRTGGGSATGGGATGGGATGGGATGGGGGATGGGATGGGATGGGGGATDGGACSPACGIGRECCNGQCVNTANNPLHCGACGVVCGGATPYCDGACVATPCAMDAGACTGGGQCCGSQCCAAGDLCCRVEGPVSGFSGCHTPTLMEPTCPMGCAPMCASDRDMKRAITPIDEDVVLESFGAMPISTWSYASDGQNVKHLGPMAQDFKAAFQLGVSDKNYDPIDAHGVQMAAIKALLARIHKLERNNADLEARIKQLERQNKRPPR